MKKTVGMLLILAAILLLNGCWSRRELDQLSIVVGLGIDKAEASENAGASQNGGGEAENSKASEDSESADSSGDSGDSGSAESSGRTGREEDPGVTGESGPLEVTAQIVLPSGIRQGTGQAGGGQAAFWNLKNSNTSVFSTLRHNTQVSNKKLYLAHMEVLIFGKSIAEEGIADYLDYFLRDPELRPGILILVAEGRAAEALSTPSKTEKLPAVNIKKLLEAQKYTSESVLVRLIDFAQKLNSEYTAPIAPLIQIEESGTASIGSGGGNTVGTGIISGGNSGGSSSGGGNSGGGTDGQQQVNDVSIHGVAVFHRDTMVGTLDSKETRGLLWATGKVQYSLLTIPAPGGECNIEIYKAKSKVKPELGEEGKVTMKIKVSGEATLGSVLTPENLAASDKLKELQGEASKLVEEEIRAAFEKAKSLHADIFGFNEKISGLHPKEWEQMKGSWEQVFQQIELNISVDIKIRDAGGLGKALPRQEGQT